eukprot:gene906-209_t
MGLNEEGVDQTSPEECNAMIKQIVISQDGLVEMQPSTKEDKNLLKVAHININGLENKLSEIIALLQKEKFDVLGITETHLTNQINDQQLMIDGYKLYRRDRVGDECREAPKGYGGFLTYVKSSLTAVPMTDKYNNSNIEAVWVELTNNSQKILIGNLYRHPKDLAFYEKLQSTLEQILAKRKNLAIVGDLNSDLLTRGKNEDEKALGKKLMSVLNSFKLNNVISEATRITEHSRTLIDVFITSNKEKIKESGVIHYGISDHSIIYAVHKMVLEKKHPLIKTVRSFRNADHKTLNRDMENAPWMVCQIFDDVDDQLDIKELMNQRFKALRTFKNTNKTEDWFHYKYLRYAVTKALRQAETKYWDTCFRETTNAKDFWTIFKKITKKDPVPMTDKYNNSNIEAVWVELTNNSQKILIGNLYRHPKDLAFYEKLQSTLEQILAKRKNLAIVGDLNSDLLTRGKNENEKALGKKLMSVLNSFKLNNVISEATRITEHSRTLIDVFITSNKEKIKESGVIHYGISDRSIIYAVHKMVLEKKHPLIKTVRSFRNADHKTLNRDMENAPWMVCQIFDDVDDQLDIKELMNQRFKALRTFKNTNKTEDWFHYKYLRYAVTKALRQAETKYWDTCFRETTNANDFWTIFKKITKKDHLEKAEALNDFFTNIGAQLAKPFEDSSESDLDRHIYRITPSIASIPPSSSGFISHNLSKLNPARATGDDNVSSRELKMVHGTVAQGLSSIINKFLDSTMYPSAWKIAKLKAAYKKGNTKDRGNYRPLSLLSVASKVYENKIGSHLDDHITFHNLSSINQWGFKAGLSTETMLLYLSEKWKEALDNNKVVGTVFIDFKKAFDTINHKVLLKKLHATGISGSVYELIESYLKDRCQYVEINGKKSKLKLVEVGVPQGSLLGPRLFAIYVNDLPTAAKIGEIHMYADDTTVSVIRDTVDEAIIAINFITEDLNNWCNHNKLTIHHDKTEAMIITTSKFNGPLLPVKIGDKNIKYVPKTKCLGIIID